ncbi:non-specific lipid-transfer C, cotyledon-specific isoform-like [Olea europaea subsp. europaea]|nr:non-specific lipid-transfer C, cotyledon-specific isoform-like [Olea europaea subsp. europaea]
MIPQPSSSIQYPSKFEDSQYTQHQIQEMKSAVFSMVFVLSLLYCFAHFSNAAIPCGTVDMKAAACISFATGKAAKPSAACCSGLQQLAQSVKSVNDKKVICRCLKAGVKNFAGVQEKFLSQIPNACKIKVGFPVSMHTNCET